MSGSRRLAILADFKEEGWPSMDLVAEMLAKQVEFDNDPRISGKLLVPKYRHLAARLPILNRMRAATNLDRIYNRKLTYSHFAKQIRSQFDCFHVTDHSYSAIIHALPCSRTGVYCHDLDAFRCLIEPQTEPRPWWFRKIASHVLAGMQKAAIVFHSTGPVRDAMLKHQLVREDQLVHAPYGVSPEFTVGSPSDRSTESAFSRNSTKGEPTVVHVGSCIPRKRIDVLIETFTEVRERMPEAKLIKVGGTFTEDQLAQIDRHGLKPYITHHQGLSRLDLAAIYRSAGVVLVTSESEGFGLPVIEALACGAPVVASDIPVLREVGGDTVGYCPVGDIAKWADRTLQILKNADSISTLDQRVAHVSQYTWARHAEIISQAYLQLAN